ncbi:DUF1000-domain-containing protein [Wallemia mellicola]|uniref:DUF1000-domain-containing protein n=1 Tax=Wallemia mellicola TaxID=1708541 RepID=A0A4T0M4W5_9BASI|nr:hypothetical protein E3Q23_01182 [Wallemia mellicola]TIB81008.1 DUF1000-domain-containing protein [Wallemia mellicola]TIC13230.1 DUF1000-domain-containing protein [Wallemia mellicola]TIC14886.1 DUF1000-domain-containing protein [Wallemia mellicola]TIC58310.1 DUF1000-domain-containing protein [Wallemia mellicola]
MFRLKKHYVSSFYFSMTCSDSCSDPNHTHDPHPSSGVDHDFLYQVIDKPNVTALNIDEDEGATGKDVIKEWTDKDDTTLFIQSDADEQLLLRIPFTASVKLKSILFKAGPGESAPSKVKIYANQFLDFGDLDSDPAATQEIELVQSSECIEYPIKISKFNSVKNLTLFFPENFGDDTSRLYFVGFKGSWTELRADPVITTYEAFANPADHKKIPGTDAGMNSLGS